MIKLGYIQGYNSYTEFKFNNANDRDAHFNNWVEHTIDAYYPPYYTNVIKVDISEVPQTTPINFVILVHNNKYYYYFVDHFNYVNEDIYEIVINMDTVLTHMFDFVVNQGTITRKSINRWNGNEINRNYVRENVSEGIMEVSEFTYRKPHKYVIVCSSHNYVDANTDSGHYSETGINYDFGYYVYVFPIPEFPLSQLATISIYSDYGQTLVSNVSYYDYISYFIRDPFTINMMITESGYLDKILGTAWVSGVAYQSCSLWLDYDVSSLDIVKINNTKVCGFNIRNLDINNNKIISKTLPFVKNTQNLELFNWKYVPQLLDENYIQLEYGDINGFTSYPMHQAKSSKFDLYNNLDVTNGNDGYYILNENETTNMHKTYTVSLGLTFDLITDPWLEYQAQNKGTLSTGLQLQAVNTLYSTVKGVATMGAGAGSSISNMTRAYYNMEKHTASITAKDTASTKMPSGSLTPVSDGLMQGINIIANYQINKENLEYAPDTVKGRANLYTMLFSKYKSPYTRVLMVNDIENCAKKLEEYGYRVNEVFNGSSYITTICTTRTYYNCISMRITEYTMTCFIPNDIINDILARIENGLRFIDVHSVPSDIALIDVFKYDNVER